MSYFCMKHFICQYCGKLIFMEFTTRFSLEVFINTIAHYICLWWKSIVFHQLLLPLLHMKYSIFCYTCQDWLVWFDLWTSKIYLIRFKPVLQWEKRHLFWLLLDNLHLHMLLCCDFKCYSMSVLLTFTLHLLPN